jgi:hypothetical protein
VHLLHSAGVHRAYSIKHGYKVSTSAIQAAKQRSLCCTRAAVFWYSSQGQAASALGLRMAQVCKLLTVTCGQQSGLYHFEARQAAYQQSVYKNIASLACTTSSTQERGVLDAVCPMMLARSTWKPPQTLQLQKKYWAPGAVHSVTCVTSVDAIRALVDPVFGLPQHTWCMFVEQ